MPRIRNKARARAARPSPQVDRYLASPPPALAVLGREGRVGTRTAGQVSSVQTLLPSLPLVAAAGCDAVVCGAGAFRACAAFGVQAAPRVIVATAVPVATHIVGAAAVAVYAAARARASTADPAGPTVVAGAAGDGRAAARDASWRRWWLLTNAKTDMGNHSGRCVWSSLPEPSGSLRVPASRNVEHRATRRAGGSQIPRRLR